MLDWLWSQPGSQDVQKVNHREKLKGFHSLAKEALTRALEADQKGQKDRAIKLYGTGLSAIQEALLVPVQGSGLGPKADSVESMKQELRSWQLNAGDRLRTLQTGVPSSIPPAQPPRTSSVATPPWNPTPQSKVSAPKSMSTAAAPRTMTQNRPRTSVQTSAVVRSTGAYSSPPKASSRAAERSSAPAAANKEDQKYRDAVLGEILDTAGTVSWGDIAGLETAKQALTEAVVLPSLRADIFQGLRAPVRGILLYGPPGNGKTMLGKALAHEAQATFFNISASSLTSKWVGDGEKLVRALFQVASEHQPAIIFIDEIDSILSARSSNENDAMRRLKTEFLVQFDGVAGGSTRVIVVGATNRPADIDDAVRRRLVKRVYIPLPGEEGRAAVMQHLLQTQKSKLHPTDFARLVKKTEGYSASDLNALCKEAAMEPIRELGPKIASVRLSGIRPIQADDFAKALNVIKPSTDRAMLKGYEDWTRDFGTK